MPKTLILFYSRTGNTARLAEALADGVRQVRFAEVDVRRIADLTPAHIIEGDATWRAAREDLTARYPTLDSVERLTAYDAIVVGTPARYGAMAAELRALFDQAAALGARGALADRVGSAFTSIATAPDGRQHTLWSLLQPMAGLGMILVPPGYADPATVPQGTPYSASAEPRRGEATEGDLAAVRYLGQRVATVAEWVRHAKSHAHGHGHGHHH